MIGQTISHYRIVEKLGEGGMGVVYIAEDTVLGRRVAIKTLHADRNSQNSHFRIRFLREARAVSALSHPHIATIHDYGETEDGQPYIVMELVKGETLGDLMQKDALTIPRAIEIISQVAEALAEAHSHGIVHRDIKPSNVAINERGNVKVLDFGLAKQIDVGSINPSNAERQTLLNTQTKEGVIVGTPMYLSPEQAMGIEVDARSDLFSLGSLLYECIAGKPPFSAGSPVEICAQIMRDDPPPPSQLNADVPKDLDRITLKALAKKPDARYQTADEMIVELGQAHTRLQTRDSDRTITRLISPAPGTHPTGALATLSDIFKRPRLSIGYVAGGLIIVGLIIFGAWRLTRARPHQPTPEAQRLYDTGANALRAGLFFQASKAFEQATKVDDRFVLAHARLAEACVELDCLDKAKDEMLRVSQLTPDRSVFTAIESSYLDAVIFTVRRDFNRAIEAYSEVARREPNQSAVYVDLGRAYEKNNESGKAIESYTKATNYDQQNAVAFLRLGILDGRQHKIPDANAAFDKAEGIYQLLGNVEGRAEVAFQRGALLNDIAGKVEEAKTQLETAREMAKVVNNQYQQIRILFQLSSVSFKLGKTDQAQQYANEAVELAQANSMETLIARGFIDLGYTYLVRADYARAEQSFQQGIDYAKRFGARQSEARAQLSLASLCMQRGEVDRALGYEEQALTFYQNGGYQTETSQALLLRGRAFQFKGDYSSALQSFEQQLKSSEQTSDVTQIAYAHANLGYLLLDSEQYEEALKHFNESYERNKQLGNLLYKGYDLLNQGATLWRLGRYNDSRLQLEQAMIIAKNNSSNFQELQAFVELIEGQVLMAQRNFHEADLKFHDAIEVAGNQSKIVKIRGEYQLALSQAQSGNARLARAMSQQSVFAARALHDPLLLARTQLAFAEVALAAGDSGSAIENAKQSSDFFANARLTESEWRAKLILGLASQLAGDSDGAKSNISQASDLFLSLKQKWGVEVFDKYIDRPDIKFYRSKLDKS